MFKTCFECLVGTNNNFTNNDSYGTRLNGNTETTMDQKNENKFLLPTSLKLNDQITIKGNMLDRNNIDLKLISASNIIYNMKIDFYNNCISYANSSGHYQSSKENSTPNDVLPDSEFSLTIYMKDDGKNNVLIHLGILNDSFEEFPLNKNSELQEIQYITLSKIVKVTELSFTLS